VYTSVSVCQCGSRKAIAVGGDEMTKTKNSQRIECHEDLVGERLHPTRSAVCQHTHRLLELFGKRPKFRVRVLLSLHTATRATIAGLAQAAGAGAGIVVSDLGGAK
jgi:hypothetical protein